MPSQVELWVGDQLHDILGLSEKVRKFCLV